MSTTISRRFAGVVGTDHQPAVGLIPKVVNDHGVFDGVRDVAVGDAAAAGGRRISTRQYCGTKVAGWFVSAARPGSTRTVRWTAD
jgi:hypothetical protein